MKHSLMFNFRKIILIILIPNIVACTPVGTPPDNVKSFFPIYNGDTLPIDEKSWNSLGYQNYPFLTNGDLACTSDEIYFYPENSFNENAVGTPLNRKAEYSIKQHGWQVNVPYKIKQGADLTQAIKIGLDICKHNIESISVKK